ncbi:MAG TPA: nuclear transport factor 2 family protein [Candidatus Dormibacteraeota bacterium]|nr:nuclear transport factor 2 family protein [Candidatus Dormibacteraeota bacterium]
MTSRLPLALAILTAFPGTFARLAATNNGPEAAVLLVESRRIQAMVNRDVVLLQQILSDDLVYTHSTAHVDDKASFIASIQSGELRYEAMKHSEVRPRIYGDTAVLTGQSAVVATSPRSNGRQSISIRFISVYAKQAGNWKQAAWQSTRIPEQ